MAKMTLTEAADRTNLLLEDAADALSKVTNRNGLKQFAIAQDFAEAALARLASVTSEPVVGRGVRIPKSPRYSASATAAFAILKLFPPGGDELLGIAEIAERLCMARSTVHRYVITLVALGQLEQPEGAGRKYRRPQIQSPEAEVELKVPRRRARRSRTDAGNASSGGRRLAAA